MRKKIKLKIKWLWKKTIFIKKNNSSGHNIKRENFNHQIAGKKTKINDVYTHIHNKPLCKISTKKNKNSVLTLSLNNDLKTKMSTTDLQNVYSKVFENTK